MKLLLDTHVLLWWLDDNRALAQGTKNINLDRSAVPASHLSRYAGSGPASFAAAAPAAAAAGPNRFSRHSKFSFFV